MTAGIVSATGRDIEAPNGLSISNVVQTDTPINHGNLGGPLLDHSGQVETLSPDLARVFRGPPSRGAMVARVVMRSPADQAGLRAATRRVTVNGVSGLLGGDVIVSVAGKPVGSASHLANELAVLDPGDRLVLEVVCGGVRRTVDLRLGDAPTGGRSVR